MKNRKIVFVFTAATVFFSWLGCEPVAIIPPKAKVTFSVSYSVDGQQLEFDTLIYANAAGNQYSVEKVEYYISNVTFEKNDGTSGVFKSVHYVNASDSKTNNLALDSVPTGSYKGLTLLIGLDKDRNKTGALPNTINNLNMAWPDAMGGGYHFLKFEGHFLDTTQKGFAMHLGKNESLVTVKISKAFTLKGNQTFKLIMNLNEWFKNPELYDFNMDGNYSMSVMMAMQKLSKNGADVFTLE